MTHVGVAHPLVGHRRADALSARPRSRGAGTMAPLQIMGWCSANRRCGGVVPFSGSLGRSRVAPGSIGRYSTLTPILVGLGLAAPARRAPDPSSRSRSRSVTLRSTPTMGERHAAPPICVRAAVRGGLCRSQRKWTVSLAAALRASCPVHVLWSRRPDPALNGRGRTEQDDKTRTFLGTYGPTPRRHWRFPQAPGRVRILPRAGCHRGRASVGPSADC